MKLNILNRHGIEATYIIRLQDYEGSENIVTEQDYYEWVESKDWPKHREYTAMMRINFLLNRDYPNHFYEFEV